MVDAGIDLRCPITLDYFRDPVTTNDNRVYERDAIIRWITITGTDPITRKELHIDELVPNKRIKKLADLRRKLSLSNSSDEDSEVGLPPLKSVCIDVPMMAVSTTDNSFDTDTRSGFCSWMCDICCCRCCCCSLCKWPTICIIILFIIGAVGISSILVASIVASRSHGS